MSNKKTIIYLAALLHDIGKFFQRADPDGASLSKLLSPEIKSLEGSISPQHWESGQYTHKHVLWTAQAMKNLQNHLAPYLKLESDWTYDKLLRLTAAHHAPSNDLLERILQKANHYSSGIDRDQQNGTGWKDAAEEVEQNWDRFKLTRMQSVFNGISLTKKWGLQMSSSKKLRLMTMSIGEDFFPIEADIADSEEDCQDLWKDFEQELRFVQNKTLQSFNESLLFLLEKYTSRIPSSNHHLTDVSLYDHSKTTAAFALCLYDYIQDRGLNEMPVAEEKPFVLVGGAISGIQKFIYSIVAKGAAKNLKGRSFYLQLLTDNIVRLLIDELGLQSGNVIYASGGSFYLIAPNKHSLSEQLSSLEKSIAKKLFEYHGTELYLSLDFSAFGETDIFNQSEDGQNIGNVWHALGEKLSEKKGRRFANILKDNFKEFFQPIAVSPETKRDTITGEELRNPVEYLDIKEQPVNSYTRKQIDLGKQLKNADYWILSRERLTFFPRQIFCIDPIGIGLYNYLVDGATIKAHEADLKASSDDVRVIYFNKKNFLEPLQKGINNVYGFAWYGGNDFPVNSFRDPKTFEELAGVTLDKPNHIEDARKESGPELTRLGVLRMDVDNLGAIFRRGLEPSKRSFSRYSTISRSLDWFFKGHLNTIWRNDENYQQFTQIIYSGGDDLFIVGKWDVLIQMASDIQAAFKKWVCGNPELTISGGLAIVGPRFPILKSAAYSATLEKAAKKHQYENQDKNAFAFIGYTAQRSSETLQLALNWESEFPYLMELKEEIKFLLKAGLPEGFTSSMYNLLQQGNMKKNDSGLFYPTEHRVAWLAAYQLKRSSVGKNDAVKDFFQKWAQAIMTGKPPGKRSPKGTQYHALQYLSLAARWAALEERSILKTQSLLQTQTT